MAEQIQELIDKIKSEGIQSGEEKAKEIEQDAQAKAQQIIDDAQKKADQLIVDAKEEVKKMQESTHMALKQSARDTLLSLRKEVESSLQKVVTAEVGGALTPEHLSQILGEVIKNSLDAKKSGNEIQVALNSKDLDKLKNGFLSKLQKQVKQEVKLHSSDDIGKGFTISFDEGKSSFDFTDESLAEYLSSFLNSQVSALVKESV